MTVCMPIPILLETEASQKKGYPGLENAANGPTAACASPAPIAGAAASAAGGRALTHSPTGEFASADYRGPVRPARPPSSERVGTRGPRLSVTTVNPGFTPGHAPLNTR